MSYDYNATLSKISTLRRQSYNVKPTNDETEEEMTKVDDDSFTELIETFSTFSTQCPMTPLLWMYYATDFGTMVRQSSPTEKEGEDEKGDSITTTNSVEKRIRMEEALTTEVSILKLGLEAFPGCGLMRLMYFDTLCGQHHGSNSSSDDNGDLTKGTEEEEEDDDGEDAFQIVRDAFEECIQFIGNGSHWNEDYLVVALYNVYLHFLIHSYNVKGTDDNPKDKPRLRQLILKLFQQRANTPFMSNGANDTILQDMQLCDTKYDLKYTGDEYDSIEYGKRNSAKYYTSIMSNTLEKDVEVAMGQEGILILSSEGSSDGRSSIESFTDGESAIRRICNIDDDVSSLSLRLYPWEDILKVDINSSGDSGALPYYLMGYGMMQTATSFGKYITSLVNYVRKEKKKKMSSKKRTNGDKHNKNHDGDDDAMDTDDDEEEEKEKVLDTITSLIVPLYERAISECPTIELLWERYIKHLLYLIEEGQGKKKPTENERETLVMMAQQLSSVCDRSVRNCPYSVKLYQLKMNATQVEVSIGLKVFDPEHLMTIVNEAIEAKFLPNPEAHLEVYLAACREVKSHILSAVSKVTTLNQFDFTDGEMMEKGGRKKRKRDDDDNDSTITFALTRYSQPLPEEIEQDVQDLLEDLREMFDTVDSFLRKNFNSYTEGRAKLFLERAMTEAYIISPMLQSFQDKDGENEKSVQSDEAIKCFEKVVRVHQPPHPNAWRSYIRYLMGKTFITSPDNDDVITEAPGMTVAKLRYVRSLYERAMISVKKQKRKFDDQAAEEIAKALEYESALQKLCEEYQDFEKMFGSEKTVGNATRVSTGKLSVSGAVEKGSLVSSLKEGNGDRDQSESHTDTNLDGKPSDLDAFQEDNLIEPKQKKIKAESESLVVENEVDTTAASKEVPAKRTNLKIPKPQPEHRVLVGKLEYPAHPFTVHVTNLSSETDDMDLVDTFCKCGNIVHARIFREKIPGQPHGVKPPSKCAGLVQFEEKRSVEEALALSDEVGLHEKLIKVSRSHLAAVGIVPPGMERSHAKGEGKNTKRNQKRRERREAAKAKKALELQSGENTHSTKGKTESQKHVVDKGIKKESKKELNTAILAFRPRGVKGSRKKTISFNGKK